MTGNALVIGPGRVGRAISSFYKPPAPLLGRQQQLPSDLAADVPVWVCTTNDGLEAVVTSTAAPAQRQQLIFVQNGMLLPWLQQHGLQHNTQVLLYMSASESGAVTDGRRTAVCGPWAQHLSATLRANGVCCAVLEDWVAFHQQMLVKLLWSSIFWMLSAGLGGKPVGLVAQQHEADVSQLVSELLPLGQAYLRGFNNSNSSSSGSSAQQQLQQRVQQQAQQNGPQQQQQQQEQMQQQLQVPAAGQQGGGWLHAELTQAAVLEQLLSYSLAIAAAVPSVEMARQEFAWRNGFFLGQARTPAHCEWLVRAGCADLLDASV